MKRFFIECDVSNDNEVAAMVDETVSKFGRLDYAFNNAGIEGSAAPTADCSTENWGPDNWSESEWSLVLHAA